MPSYCLGPIAILVSHTFGNPVAQLRHIPQGETKAIMQRSPGLTLVTPSPTSTTVPAPSWPSTAGKSIFEWPCIRWWSLRQRPDAPICTRTSPALGGSCRSSFICSGVFVS